jgi:hypothetical protein
MNYQKIHELINAVKSMRKAQKNYFATKNHSFLLESKHFEKKVDVLLQEAEVDSFQTSLDVGKLQ